MSFKKFNDLYCEFTIANDRAGIKHQTVKFQGPVGLGGMNDERMDS